MEKIKVIVTAVSRYNFTDQDTGRQVQGCAVHYLDTQKNQSEHTMGYMPGKANVDYLAYDRLSRMEFPQICEAELVFNLASKNKTWKIKDFNPLGILACEPELASIL
jgi:hypothetical protein